MSDSYSQATRDFISELEKHNLSLSQFADLMDAYHLLPPSDTYHLWKKEVDKEKDR